MGALFSFLNLCQGNRDNIKYLLRICISLLYSTLFTFLCHKTMILWNHFDKFVPPTLLRSPQSAPSLPLWDPLSLEVRVVDYGRKGRADSRRGPGNLFDGGAAPENLASCQRESCLHWIDPAIVTPQPKNRYLLGLGWPFWFHVLEAWYHSIYFEFYCQPSQHQKNFLPFLTLTYTLSLACTTKSDSYFLAFSHFLASTLTWNLNQDLIYLLNRPFRILQHEAKVKKHRAWWLRYCCIDTRRARRYGE